jgi:hypothetical protein
VKNLLSNAGRATAWVLTIGVIIALSLHEVHFWGMRQLRNEADIMHVADFVSIASVALLVIFLHIRARPRPVVLGCAAVFLLFFALSLRSWSVDGGTGEVIEYWAGLVVKRDPPLLDIDNQPYCYYSTALFLGVRSADARTTRRYFLGIWPSRPSEKEIDRAFSFGRCPAR